MHEVEFDDWTPAPNISRFPAVYERENRALLRDGRLDQALADMAPWQNKTVVDIGCGTGFWLPIYAESAHQVIGIEPDPDLRHRARQRCAQLTPGVVVAAGSAEHMPLQDNTADVVHARFAYFFGPGSERGFQEVQRVLKPGGTFVAIDNSWSGGDFARLLRASTIGNGAIDPEATTRWWHDRGVTGHDILGGWKTGSSDELEQILRIEFPNTVVDNFMATHHEAGLTYRFMLYHYRKPLAAEH